jgi:hypothetical protein
LLPSHMLPKRYSSRFCCPCRPWLMQHWFRFRVLRMRAHQATSHHSDVFNQRWPASTPIRETLQMLA